MNSEHKPSCRYCGVEQISPRCPLRGVREGACRMVTTMSQDEYRVWKEDRKRRKGKS